MKSLILTAIGPDRPGLVEELASAVAENGGNWIESRMARLGGEFAGIVRVEVAPDAAAALRDALATISGLQVTASDSTPPKTDGAVTEAVTLDLVGSDRPGIVSSIARALAARDVNVEDLDTERISAPMSGEPLFKASAKIVLPAGLELSELQADLEAIAADLMVDLTLAS